MLVSLPAVPDAHWHANMAGEYVGAPRAADARIQAPVVSTVSLHLQ